MDLDRPVYGRRWPGLTASAVGTAVFGAGLLAPVTNGRDAGRDRRGDLQRLGSIVFLVGLARISHQAHAARMRTAYRSGRIDRRQFGKVVVPLPRRDEAER